MIFFIEMISKIQKNLEVLRSNIFDRTILKSYESSFEMFEPTTEDKINKLIKKSTCKSCNHEPVTMNISAEGVS
jgi:hypothetical protein